MKTAKRFRHATAALLLLVLVSACSDNDLMTLSRALDDTAKGVAVFQTTVIQANVDKLISNDTTTALLGISIKINQAGQQGVILTRGLAALSPADRTNVLAVLRPVIDTVGSTLQSGLVNITDTKTRDNIRATLLVVQTSLNAANLALSAH